MISQQTIAEVKEKANILEVVGETVSLKRRGVNNVGLCPFHAEKSPSFNVHEDQKYYHCFGCGVSGGVIDFVMRLQGLSFPEAVEQLAARYGVPITFEGGKEHKREKPMAPLLYRINILAQEFFERELLRAEPVVKNYLLDRGLKPETLKAFGVGFAPNSWNALRDFLLSQKVPEELLLKSGLIRRSPRGDLYDVFRARIMFPVWMDGRRIAGFGGRTVPALAEANQDSPKYLNSSETEIYLKHRILFGLPQAREAMREKSSLYLVEGYMDVLGLWQAGVRNTLATCGTAVTEDHVKRISRLVPRVQVLFDGDHAGRAAAGKSFSVFLNSGVDTAARFLSAEDDPDTLALKHGADTAQILDSLPQASLFDCYIDLMLEKFGCKEASELGAATKGRLADEIAVILRTVKNGIEQNELIQRAAYRLRLESSQIEKVVTQGGSLGVHAEKESLRNSGSASGLNDEDDDEDENEGSLTGTVSAVEDLPRVDQEILYVVMAKRADISSVVLRDPDLCSGLHYSTRGFIESLDLLFKKFPEEQHKLQIKNLLRRFGPSWVAHWKLSYQMLEDSTVSMDRSFQECCRTVKKGKLNQLINDVNLRLRTAKTVEEKEQLLTDKFALTRKLKENT